MTKKADLKDFKASKSDNMAHKAAKKAVFKSGGQIVKFSIS